MHFSVKRCRDRDIKRVDRFNQFRGTSTTLGGHDYIYMKESIKAVIKDIF